MTVGLDRRRNAFRDDLADAALKGRVEAARFTTGQAYHVAVTIAPLHPQPASNADLDTQVLGGEAVQVFDVADGWAWCQLAGDGYVGYTPVDMLAVGPPPPPTHRVAARETFAYHEPTARSKPMQSWLFGATLQVVDTNGDFLRLANGGFVGRQHVAAIDTFEPDYAATAQTLLGTPYLWGGKSVRGIDCSGLVQLSLLRAGIACPRDTDMQARELPGDLAVTENSLDQLQRGDLVYWPGHVGIMIDSKQIVHANGTHMSTTIEPVTLAAERSRQDGAIAKAIKRFQ